MLHTVVLYEYLLHMTLWSHHYLPTVLPELRVSYTVYVSSQRSLLSGTGATCRRTLAHAVAHIQSTQQAHNPSLQLQHIRHI